MDLLKLDLRETLKLVKAKTLIIGAPNTNAEVTKANFEKQYANLDFKTIEVKMKTALTKVSEFIETATKENK